MTPGTATLVAGVLAAAAGEPLARADGVAAPLCAAGADKAAADASAPSGGANAGSGDEVVPLPFADDGNVADLMVASAIGSDSAGSTAVVCAATGAVVIGAVAAAEAKGAGGC